MTLQSGAHKLVVTGKKLSGLYCEHCKYTGHIIDKCFRIHGYPANFVHKGQESSCYGTWHRII